MLNDHGLPGDPVQPVLRAADEGDLEQLVAIEQRCFDGDKLSKRSFRRFIHHPNACLIVADQRGILGYGLVLMRQDSDCARIYSIAVQPDRREQGLGKTLLEQLEAAAKSRGRKTVILEVRRDNHGAIKLYEQMGYRRFGTKRNYYQDGADALRLEKEMFA